MPVVEGLVLGVAAAQRLEHQAVGLEACGRRASELNTQSVLLQAGIRAVESRSHLSQS